MKGLASFGINFLAAFAIGLKTSFASFGIILLNHPIIL